jgi:arylsulfatase A-like enzyme
VGASLGGALGLGGQLAVAALAARPPESSVLERAGGEAYALALWLFVALVLALVGRPLLGRRAGRALAIALSTLGFAALALLTITGALLRVTTGSYLTTGAVVFSLGSVEHFLGAAARHYRPFVLAAAGVLAAIASVAALSLCRAARAPSSTRPPGSTRIDLALAAGLALLLGAGYASRTRGELARGLFAAAPLPALLRSLDLGEGLDAREGLGAPLGPLALAAELAPAGPPLAETEAWARAAGAAGGPRPNVVLLVLESVAPGHLGYLGYARPTTPALDALARRALVMRRAWAAATHSNYAQMALLSSLFPRRGHQLDQYTRLDYPRVLFHDLFHALGYRTATISSQDERWQGMRRFQETGTPTYFWYAADYDGEKIDIGTELVVPDARTVDVVGRWLGGLEPGRPWALYVNFQATHFPYSLTADVERPFQPSEPTWATFTYLAYPRAELDVAVNRYDNALRYVDAQVGRLRALLEQRGELERTLLVVTADHGETFFEKGLVTHGRTLYDVEARVPLLLHWPERLAAEVRDKPVSHLDVLPTVLELLELPPHPAFQGRSFARAGDPGRHAIYMNIQGLRHADAIVCWPFKLILERTDGTAELFDLERDPAEEHNLVERYAEVAARLRDTLTAQLLAQLAYHAPGAAERAVRYQPRLRPCPP